MRLPRGALVDPGPDLGDLLRFQFFVRLRRRHDLVFVLRSNALVEGALVGLALDDGRRLFLAVLVLAGGEEAGFGVEAQARLAGAGVGAVAVEAVVREHRTDIAVELHGFFGRVGGGQEEGQERQEGLTHGEGGMYELKG